jgi:tryptophan synthase alpha chain
MTIQEAFEKAKSENRVAVIPYFTAGYPTLNDSYRVFLAMAKSGADIIEIGIPFSDPLADGPTIQFSSSVALSNGINTEKVFLLTKKLSEKTTIPLVVMTYYNILYAYGLEKFATEASKNGIKGVIIPDLPPEEAGRWLNISKGIIETIFLAAPTSSPDRLKMIASESKSFIYCVSITGVTGSRDSLDKNLAKYVKKVKKISSVPVVVGFGVSSISQAKQIKEIADGVVVGSAFIKLYHEAKKPRKALKNISRLIRSLRSV